MESNMILWSITIASGVGIPTALALQAFTAAIVSLGG